MKQNLREEYNFILTAAKNGHIDGFGLLCVFVVYQYQIMIYGY